MSNLEKNDMLNIKDSAGKVFTFQVLEVPSDHNEGTYKLYNFTNSSAVKYERDFVNKNATINLTAKPVRIDSGGKTRRKKLRKKRRKTNRRKSNRNKNKSQKNKSQKNKSSAIK